MLSDTAIKRLQPRATPYRVHDECGIPGFGIQITPAGGRGYFLRYTVPGSGGKRRYLNLGHWPQTPLSAARDKARAALAQLDQGLDPQSLPEPAAALGSFQMLIDAWLAHQQDRGRRRLDAVRRTMEVNVSAALRERPAASIQPADIRGILATVHHRGARVAANRLRSALHTCFQYGLLHDHDPRTMHQAVLFGLTSNPVSAVPADPGAESVGERVLSWSEVRMLWDAEPDTLTWPARQGSRLLLVFGSRVNEIVQSPWREWDLNRQVWTLPAARTKGKRDVLTPIPGLALTLLAELQGAMSGDWLFPARWVAGAAQPWGAESLGRAVRRWSEAVGIVRADARDLRRTWKTLAGESGLSLEIRNRLQGHALQDVGSRHYDRHSYLPEKQAALETWCAYLTGRLAGDNVIPLRRAGQARVASG